MLFQIFKFHSISRRILQISNGVNESGDLNWEMGACLLVAWILLYFSIRKSVRWSGKESSQSKHERK